MLVPSSLRSSISRRGQPMSPRHKKVQKINQLASWFWSGTSPSIQMHSAARTADNDETDDFAELEQLEARRQLELERLLRNTPGSPEFARKRMIIINVSGLRYEISATTLALFPETLLGNPTKRQPYFNPENEEYFFERHRPSFDAILYYYQSGGYLKRPSNIPAPIFERECRFFEVGPKRMERASSKTPSQSREDALPKSKWRRKVFLLLEFPDSSRVAKIIGIISFCIILLSTVSFCLETLPDLQAHFKCSHGGEFNMSAHNLVDFSNCSTWSDPFFVVETLCIFWFTLEFLLRFVACPSRRKFAQSFLNWVDFIAIAPFYINLILSDGNSAASFAILRVLRLVRVFRVFKLSRHSRGLQILGRTLTASIQELLLLIFFLLMALVLSGSAIYFAENGINPQFTSIPEAFWFGIITLTTVGYGDITPITPAGKLVGAMCAIIGVLVLALPVTVIVSNFKRFYEQEINMQNMRSEQAAAIEGATNSESEAKGRHTQTSTTLTTTDLNVKHLGNGTV